MRTLAVILALAPTAAAAQQEPQLALTPSGSNQPVFEIVAADRETAWRINRVTGEVTVCRIDTTGGLDAVRARCAPAAMQGAQGAQQSMTPAEGGTR